MALANLGRGKLPLSKCLFVPWLVFIVLMCECSIIAVHGLGANPDHAWVRHKDQSAGLENDVRWLTDLLPQTFRNYKPSLSARIFCFNYQSAWLGPQLSKNRLEGLAVRLLDDIHNARDKVGPFHKTYI